ncbi:tyrosine-type recombinase/integrase [Nonomuraea turcica]|uniref:hypothetical protein n=1 Tax=Nonomuraea sp. G32 TaxID=3067274 RepID=UPI00352FF231
MSTSSRGRPTFEGTSSRFVVIGQPATLKRKPATVEMSRMYARTHLLPELGKRKLRDLSVEDVDQWLQRKTNDLSTRSLKILQGWRSVAEIGWDHNEFALHVWRSVRKKGRPKPRSPDAASLCPNAAWTHSKSSRKLGRHGDGLPAVDTADDPRRRDRDGPHFPQG